MPPLVKICGLKTAEAADEAIRSGADLLGLILVPGRQRTVSHITAADIARRVREGRKTRKYQTLNEIIQHMNQLNFDSENEYFETFAKLISENRPFLVGVFRNQEMHDVFQIARDCNLDFIQLHGSEDLQNYLEFNADSRFGIIRRFVIPDDIETMQGLFPKLISSPNNGFSIPLLDSEKGGEGVTIDWSLLNNLNGKFLLAGGLTAENLEETKPYLSNVIGFDVSGGVEDEHGHKDLRKINQFIVKGKEL